MSTWAKNRSETPHVPWMCGPCWRGVDGPVSGPAPACPECGRTARRVSLMPFWSEPCKEGRCGECDLTSDDCSHGCHVPPPGDSAGASAYAPSRNVE